NDAMRLVFEAIGATRVQIDDNLETYSGAGHIMGTCRMGHQPATSVVDPELRVHEHPNLFVVGASAFPTGGTANPTLTVAALALRAAERIRRELGASPPLVEGV